MENQIGFDSGACPWLTQEGAAAFVAALTFPVAVVDQREAQGPVAGGEVCYAARWLPDGTPVDSFANVELTLIVVDLSRPGAFDPRWFAFGSTDYTAADFGIYRQVTEDTAAISRAGFFLLHDRVYVGVEVLVNGFPRSDEIVAALTAESPGDEVLIELIRAVSRDLGVEESTLTVLSP